MELITICENAKASKYEVAKLSTNKKNEVLICAADRLLLNAGRILEANEIDIDRAGKANMPKALIDRLYLSKERIEQIAECLREIAALEDPVGEVLQMKKRPNGLVIGQKRVPLGVIGIIYESRPNVTADAFGLCFKAGNTVILRGGKDAIHSNVAIVRSITETLMECGVTEHAIQLIEDTDHETAKEFMHMNEYVDVLIPRGGAGLIKTVVTTATIPVIETGTGNCHVFVDASADLEMAKRILINAKTQRIGVCNACESLLIHKDILDDFVPMMVDALSEFQVEIRADDKICSLADSNQNVIPATESDWGTEYLDYIISAKTVNGIEEAIDHINKYNTGHSETIVTNDYQNAEKFLDEVDAAAVYVNASTRFTDGFEFGFGAEIGISTQKLHARGPMGLKELTSTKYIIYGNGQIR
ncbi:MAG: glutamate-5-semialdehyde dehydrogenase [Lachnospiraceae bacterium]